MTLDSLDVRPENDGASQPVLQVTLTDVGTTCVLTLRGALDARSVGVLEAELDNLGRMSCRRVIVDLAALIALDGTGRRVLTGLAHYVRGRGGTLRVIGKANHIPGVLGCEPADE